MFKKLREVGSKIWTRGKMAITSSTLALSTMYMLSPVPVFASNSYIEPINKLKTVMLSIVGAAGVIVLLYGVVKFAESFQKKDQNGEYSAIYTIVAGAIMIGASAIITALT